MGKQGEWDKDFRDSLLISINWSIFNSAPVIGSQPFSVIYFSTTRRSKMAPDRGEITGCSGIS